MVFNSIFFYFECQFFYFACPITKYIDGISGIVDKNYCYIDYPSIIKKYGLNGYSKASNIDTSKYHYDVNNDGKVDNQDLQALQDYLNK